MYRTDVQILRAIAVLAVIFYHADFAFFNHGYLGVDVFFVISGYVITGVILRDLAESNFSFADFYFRRFRRLYPAFLSTIVFTTVLSMYFLAVSQWQDYAYLLTGAIGLSANIALMFQSGYFSEAAQMKPLLHLWSLSLEEQFYIFLPLFLFFTPAKNRFPLLIVLAIISMTLCYFLISSLWPFTGQKSWQDLAFYSLPSRAWQLLCGSMAAAFIIKHPPISITRKGKVLIIAVVLGLFSFQIGESHPGINSLLVSALTVVTMISGNDFTRKGTTVKSFCLVGDMSYSLYLVHWPLLALLEVIFIGEVPPITIAVWFISVFVLAYLQFRFIEQRYREPWGVRTLRNSLFLAFLTASLLLLVYTIKHINSDLIMVINKNSELNLGLHPICSQKGNKFKPQSECTSDSNPQIIVWGDSFGMHLVPGLVANDTSGRGILQATKSACSPILGVAQVHGRYTEAWARTCLDFNQSVFQHILTNDTITHIILGSPFSHVFKHDNQKLYVDKRVTAFNMAHAKRRLINQISELDSKGLKVFLLSPTPTSNFDIGACNRRISENKLILGRDHCTIANTEARDHWITVTEVLADVTENSNAEYIDYFDLLCTDTICRSTADGFSLYRDATHYTADGSIWVAKELDLPNQLFRRKMR